MEPIDGGTVAGFLCYVFGVHALNSLALSTGDPASLGFAIVSLALALVPAGLYAWLQGYWRLWLFWRPLGVPVRALAAGAFAALICLSQAFASLTMLLADQGALELAKAFPQARDTFGMSGTFGQLELYHLWHFADAIPALEVPDTLNWDEPEYFDGLGAGSLLLAYKLLVVLPVLTVLVAVFRRPDRAARE